MILTRDNLLRYVREKKAVTPTMVSEDFDTSTMIASAALSDIAKEKLIAITFLKLSSSPYYYDPKQSEVLIEIGEKHLSSYDKEIFQELKDRQIINGNSLSIQHNLAVERIKDFAKPLIIKHEGKEIKFWIWYQRNLDDTKKQIMDALNPNSTSLNNSISSSKLKESKKKELKKNQEVKKVIQREIISPVESKTKITGRNQFFSDNNFDSYNKKELNKTHEKKNVYLEGDSSVSNLKEEIISNFKPVDSQVDKVDQFIKNYLRNNYLKIESMQKLERGVKYDVTLIVNKIKFSINCFYFSKKPTDYEVIKFYTNGIKPKIIFIENTPKKLFKLAEDLENLTIVNI